MLLVKLLLMLLVMVTLMVMVMVGVVLALRLGWWSLFLLSTTSPVAFVNYLPGQQSLCPVTCGLGCRLWCFAARLMLTESSCLGYAAGLKYGVALTSPTASSPISYH